MKASKDWKERIADDEETRFRAHAETLLGIARARDQGSAKKRALHTKGNIGLRARFTVLGDLPEEARVGLFREPAGYDAWVRFSNGSPSVQSDRKGDVRGIAVKVLGVTGTQIIPELAGATTQDFLLIRSPTTPVRNTDEFLALVRAAQSPALLLPRLIGAVGFGRAFAILKQGLKSLGAPIPSLASTHYFSALPIRFGDYAVRYALRPRAASPPGQKTPPDLGADLRERLAAGAVSYDFQVQFFEDEARTPIEDASRDWGSPYVTLGRLDLVAPGADHEQVVARVESLRFDPWHGLTEFRPLGDMMRARKIAYLASAEERKGASEPTAME